MRVVGVDFTSAPSRRKPIVVAHGSLDGDRVAIERVERLVDWASFDALLAAPGPWVGAFDFPFGLPRELVDTLRWPGARARSQRGWRAMIAHYAALDREAIKRTFARWRDKRPAGRKYAHRATDRTSFAHPSMKLVNPPVGWMLYQGAPRLLAAGVHIPGISRGDPKRVALEAYPGFMMRTIANARGEPRAPSYKSDDRRRQTEAHRDARVGLMQGLIDGANGYGMRTDLSIGLFKAVADDGTGDTLDAIACAVQAGWGAQRAKSGYGLPSGMDPIEGWIVGS